MKTRKENYLDIAMDEMYLCVKEDAAGSFFLNLFLWPWALQSKL